ncbi:ankyrin-3 [Plakobranchus ocellatus]|uniref:Ankyrin-3 n=1 Tax=Plakobranchus ocellatus TaxID=259542 RepID=A0AAV3XVC4_9GAST|nr:ankyrin-3 [Plakobranchus ocellatus]
MGAYSSSFIANPKSNVAVSSFSHPSKPNWITAHAIATELSIAEVERLWLRFEQMGATKDGLLTPQVLASPALSSDVFVKNILKCFKSADGNISFESFLKALKWCESQEMQVKARAMFQMLNSGNPIPKDIFLRILSRIYPEESEEEVKRITDVFFKAVDMSRKGVIDEPSFVHAVLGLPRQRTQSILNFHILPEQLRQDMHNNLPEFSSQAAYHSPSPYVSQVPSDNILKEVAEKIHRKDWDLVANRLGFFADDISAIRSKNPDSTFKQAFDMLKTWKIREGSNAKASTLERTLRNAGMVEASLLLAP